MLRAAMLQGRSGQMQALEQFSFTQLQIGGVVTRKQLKPSLREQDFKAYSEQQVAGKVASPNEWEIRGAPHGFHLVKVMKRGSSRGEVTHMLFSDGLSTVSMFLEPLNPKQKPMHGLSVKEATYLYARPIGSYQLTVLGDAPEATVMQFANSLTPRSSR